MYYANVNVNLMVENVIHNKSVIIINIVAGAKIPHKNCVCEKRLYLKSCYMQLQNDEYLVSIINDSVVKWDTIIDAEAKS